MTNDSKKPSKETRLEMMASTTAAIVKTFGVKSAMVMSGWIKGFLQWWFRYPIKLFRPSTTQTPWSLVKNMADHRGRKVSVRFVRQMIAEEGWTVISKNMLPLMVANASVGVILFQTFTHSHAYFSHYYHPISASFLSGTLGGLLQTVLGTPLDNVQKLIKTSELVKRRKEGMLQVTMEAVHKHLPHQNKLQFLYKHWSLHLMREGLGFGLFFGTFESIRTVGLESWGDRYRPYIVLTAGAAAGSTFQMVTYPLDCFFKKRPVKALGKRMLLGMPPSALALLVYEFMLK